MALRIFREERREAHLTIGERHMLWHRMRTLLFYGGDRRSYVSIIRRLASRGACYRHNQSTKMTASADAKNEDQVGYTFSGSGGGG